MPKFLDLQTTGVLFSALLAAIFCIWAEDSEVFIFVLMAHGAYFIETMFHELGHCVTGWLLGMPGVPMIFTLVGPRGSGGLTWNFGHYWILQGAVIAGLIYLAYIFYGQASKWFYPVILLLLIIVAVVLSGKRELVVTYMGHGGTILASGYFLYKAWLDIGVTNQYRRWLCGFVGFYMALQNIYFSYNLIHDEVTKQLYADSEIMNDFLKMAEYVYGWTVEGVARFNMIFGAATIIGSFLVSLYVFMTSTGEEN